MVEKVETETVAKSEPAIDPKTLENEKASAVGEKTKPRPELIVTDPMATDAKNEAPPRRATTNRRNTSARRTPPKAKTEEKVAAKEPETEKPGETKADEKPVETRASVEERSTPEKPVAETNAAAENKSVSDETAVAEKKPEEPGFRTLTGRKRSTPAKKPAPEPKPDPLASINLVIQFKDGNLIEKPMSEVFKFSVDKGVLTVALKNGSTSRYKIIDVEKVTIQ